MDVDRLFTEEYEPEWLDDDLDRLEKSTVVLTDDSFVRKELIVLGICHYIDWHLEEAHEGSRARRQRTIAEYDSYRPTEDVDIIVNAAAKLRNALRPKGSIEVTPDDLRQRANQNLDAMTEAYAPAITQEELKLARERHRDWKQCMKDVLGQ